MSYEAQIKEGMKPLTEAEECLACKYCGGGWGGYAMHLFGAREQRDAFVHSHIQAQAVEPYTKGYRNV